MTMVLASSFSLYLKLDIIPIVLVHGIDTKSLKTISRLGN